MSATRNRRRSRWFSPLRPIREVVDADRGPAGSGTGHCVASAGRWTAGLVLAASLAVADAETDPAGAFDSRLGNPAGQDFQRPRGMRLRAQQDFGDYWGGRKRLDSGDPDSAGFGAFRREIPDPPLEMNPWKESEVLIVMCGLVYLGLQLRKEPWQRRATDKPIGTASGPKGEGS